MDQGDMVVICNPMVLTVWPVVGPGFINWVRPLCTAEPANFSGVPHTSAWKFILFWVQLFWIKLFSSFFIICSLFSPDMIDRWSAIQTLVVVLIYVLQVYVLKSFFNHIPHSGPSPNAGSSGMAKTKSSSPEYDHDKRSTRLDNDGPTSPYYGNQSQSKENKQTPPANFGSVGSELLNVFPMGEQLWHFPILTLSNSDPFHFWPFPILTLSNSDPFQFWPFPFLILSNDPFHFWQFLILTLSNDPFHFRQYLIMTLSNYDTFQFWHFPILTLVNSDIFKSLLVLFYSSSSYLKRLHGRELWFLWWAIYKTWKCPKET